MPFTEGNKLASKDGQTTRVVIRVLNSREYEEILEHLTPLQRGTVLMAAARDRGITPPPSPSDEGDQFAPQPGEKVQIRLRLYPTDARSLIMERLSIRERAQVLLDAIIGG